MPRYIAFFWPPKEGNTKSSSKQWIFRTELLVSGRVTSTEFFGQSRRPKSHTPCGVTGPACGPCVKWLGVLPSLKILKLTVRTWKWMVGILVSFWDGLFSGAMLVLGGVNKVLFEDGLLLLKLLDPAPQILRHVKMVATDTILTSCPK